MVALLTAESLNVVVLLDKEKASEETKRELLQAKLIKESSVVFVSEAVTPEPSEADIEDLLDPHVYDALVREAYAKELKGKKLEVNDSIPRVAKRFEAALKDLGIEFHKTRPSRLFVSKMASDCSSVLTNDSLDKFEALFKIINERLHKLHANGGSTF
jgi:hypothetical protein